MLNMLTRLAGLLVAVGLAAVAPLASGGTPSPTSPFSDPHAGSYLGVHIDDVTPDRAVALKLKDASGVVITDIDQDGPACKAGLKENDVIISFNGSKVANPVELANMIHAAPAGQTVPMSVMRDGQKKDLLVTLGSSGQIVARDMANEKSRIAMHSMPYPPMMAPDIDIPSFNALSARHGMIVESLSPQLCDYFGVPKGRGVLLRSVEKGSSAESAGLKAGDVIVKLNGEDVHDIADWRRSLHGHSGKTSITFVRDKREQTVYMMLPAPPTNSKLQDFDWDGFNGEEFDKEMQAFRQQMETLGPELAERQREILASIRPNQRELEQMQREIQKSMTLNRKDIERMTRDIQKSLPTEKQMAEMRAEIQKSLPSQKQIDDMRAEIQNSLPDPKQIESMRRQIEDSMKNWTPQLQHQMDELKKQMEQFKFDMQQQDSDMPREF